MGDVGGSGKVEVGPHGRDPKWPHFSSKRLKAGLKKEAPISSPIYLKKPPNQYRFMEVGTLRGSKEPLMLKWEGLSHQL